METLPRLGKLLYCWWMKFAAFLAFVNARILLTLVYFVIIGPISLIVRLMGKDYLDRAIKASESSWKAKKPLVHSLRQSERQF
jgi:hypothetical protein